VMGYQGASDALDVYRELAIGMYNGLSCTVSSGKQDEEATAEILASLHIGFEPRSSDRDMASYGADVVTDEVSRTCLRRRFPGVNQGWRCRPGRWYV